MPITFSSFHLEVNSLKVIVNKMGRTQGFPQVGAGRYKD